MTFTRSTNNTDGARESCPPGRSDEAAEADLLGQARSADEVIEEERGDVHRIAVDEVDVIEQHDPVVLDDEAWPPAPPRS